MERARNVLAAVTVAACLPYLTLKLVWLSGGRLGIPRGSPLLDSGATMWALNALTVAMDGTVVLLVLALTRPWGRRLPGAVVALPLWIACGLLGPIVVAFPVQLLHGVLGGSGGDGSDKGADGLLESWVWTLVYTGFSVQAIALGALFVLYVRDRWGALLRSPLYPPYPGTAAPDGPGGVHHRRRGLFAAAVLVALPWAVGQAVWMTEGSADSRIVDATFLLYAVLAVAAVAKLLRTGGTERGATARLWPTLAAAWSGTGVLACWGGWLLLGALSGGGRTLGQETSGTALLAYSCQALAGLLLAALGARQLRHRARTHSRGATV
ncbi:hypothetical protein ITI46_03820 [Streptomyces oryzae]|uniref:LigA protein n=1 Tax=Streptomyces oryzae TaxID=1434886 RepID=A0ABS3X633_9ACTN|nr:hypothetical protein [Streptomyces oryzae]MBO8190828.1 hypothetical protein [Streptomyces oryzae]